MIKRANNSTLAIGGVSSPLDSFVVAESSVLHINPYMAIGIVKIAP